MLTPLVLALLCLLPGLPLAVLLARSRRGRTAFGLVVTEALVLGLVWYLLLGLVLAHRHELGRVQLLIPTLVLVAAVVAVLLVGPARRWSGVVDNPRGSALTTFLIAAFVVGAALRTKPAYFLYQIGDFGEYVNRGNVLADGGSFTQWFTNGFSVLMGLSSVTLGEAHEVEVMGFLGLAVMAVILAVATRLGASAWGRAAVAVAFAIGVVPVWYSNFPASETFYALLLSGMLLFLVAAVQDEHRVSAGVAGVLAFCLMLTRGNAVLVIPLLLGFALAAAPFVRRTTLQIIVTFVAASSVGLFAGFVYNSRYNHPYFIRFQMPQFFPDAVWHRFADLGGLRAASWKGAIFAAVVALALWLVVIVNRRLAGTAIVARVEVLLLPLVLLVAVAALFWPLDAGGLREALETYEGAMQALLVVGALGAFAAFARPASEVVRVGVLFAALFAVTYALVHAFRFGAPRTAPYYLYWDRYLWSEFLPMMLLLAALGVGLLELAIRRLPRGRTPAGVALLALGVIGAGTMWQAGALGREHRFMGDAYGQLAEIDELLGDEPIVFRGRTRSEALSQPVLHPNTFRLFAQPLGETFGRRFLNLRDVGAYADDPLPSVAEARRMLAAAGYDRGYWLQVLAPGEQLQPGVEPIGVVDVVIPMLDSPRWREPDGWRFARWRVGVGELDAA